ncbi:hypothetical protein [Paenibacillus guangzhouensis]|uniref:hypothetical protein n=1 Tax=Paenibacillus guangzhouensis TaxID=1473112 RepID=UPI001266AB65|nr:hypothetical protein [Paenibacillus guangzhouensis]
MRQVMVIGSCEQSDFLLLACKVLSRADGRVLFIDGSKSRSTTHYISSLLHVGEIVEFEGFDIGVHFSTVADVLKWLAEQDEDAYEYVIFQSDDRSFYGGCSLEGMDAHVILTQFDKGSIQRNEQILTDLRLSERPVIPFIGLYVPYVVCSIQEEYIEEKYNKLAVQWSEEKVRIPYDERLYERFIDGQFAERLNLRKLPRAYRRQIISFIQRISGLEMKQVKQAYRMAGRR